MAAVELPHQPCSALGQLSPILGHPGLLRIPIPEQDQQLARGETGADVCALGPPGEAPLGETLRTEPEALAVIAQELERRAGAIAEDEERATERLLQEHTATHGCQAIDAFAEIDRLGRQQDPRLRAELEHQAVSKKVRTNATSGGCGSWAWIRSRVPSARWSSISIPSVGCGQTGGAVTSTKPRAVEAGADRAV